MSKSVSFYQRVHLIVKLLYNLWNIWAIKKMRKQKETKDWPLTSSVILLNCEPTSFLDSHSYTPASCSWALRMVYAPSIDFSTVSPLSAFFFRIIQVSGTFPHVQEIMTVSPSLTLLEGKAVSCISFGATTKRILKVSLSEI